MGPKLLQLQTSRDQYREENKAAANLVELRDTLKMDVETLSAESGMVSDGRQAQKLISDIESKISIINDKESQLKPYFEELLGIKYITIGNKSKASFIFDELSSSENTPFDLKVRLEKLIQIAS